MADKGLTTVREAGCCCLAAGKDWKTAQAVVTDMMMPVMDGPTTIRALQRLDKAVRIVAMSGLAEQSKVVEVMSGSVRAFLTKPFTAATLLQMLHEVLHESL